MQLPNHGGHALPLAFQLAELWRCRTDIADAIGHEARRVYRFNRGLRLLGRNVELLVAAHLRRLPTPDELNYVLRDRP